MKEKKPNLGASVTARLLNRARADNIDYSMLLASYCHERLLYRIGRSDARDRFVLKGAMLLRVWSEHPYRATRDLDLLRRGDGTSAAIISEVRAVCGTKVEPDGVEFVVDQLEIEPIRAADEYAGTRAVLPARCGTARLRLQIDMALGDRNSRIKDFFDLHHLAFRFEFDRAVLTEAVRRTFERRRTPIPAEAPIGLMPE